MPDEFRHVPARAAGFHVIDGRAEERGLVTISRGFPGRVFSSLDSFFEPPEDGESDGSFRSAAALVHSEPRYVPRM